MVVVYFVYASSSHCLVASSLEGAISSLALKQLRAKMVLFKDSWARWSNHNPQRIYLLAGWGSWKKPLVKKAYPSFERVLCWAAGLTDWKPAVDSGFLWIRESWLLVSKSLTNLWTRFPSFLYFYGTTVGMQLVLEAQASCALGYMRIPFCLQTDFPKPRNREQILIRWASFPHERGSSRRAGVYTTVQISSVFTAPGPQSVVASPPVPKDAQ